jgi:hypothetical protein
MRDTPAPQQHAHKHTTTRTQPHTQGPPVRARHIRPLREVPVAHCESQAAVAVGCPSAVVAVDKGHRPGQAVALGVACGWGRVPHADVGRQREGQHVRHRGVGARVAHGRQQTRVQGFCADEGVGVVQARVKLGVGWQAARELLEAAGGSECSTAAADVCAELSVAAPAAYSLRHAVSART